jgi:hypothetical protein
MTMTCGGPIPRAVPWLRALLAALVGCVALTAAPSWAGMAGSGQFVQGTIRSGSPCLKGSVWFLPGSVLFPGDPTQVDAIDLWQASVTATASCGSSTPVSESILVIAVNILYYDWSTNAWTSCFQPLQNGALATNVAYNASSVGLAQVGIGAGVCPKRSWVMAQLTGWAWDATAGVISGSIYSSPTYFN